MRRESKGGEIRGERGEPGYIGIMTSGTRIPCSIASIVTKKEKERAKKLSKKLKTKRKSKSKSKSKII